MSRITQFDRQSEPDAIQLVEEAIHLLRRTPLSAWSLYGATQVPFLLGFLFFWAHATWLAPTDAELAWAALGLVVLYAILKTGQSEFCGRLLAQRLGTTTAPLSLRRWGDLLVSQFRIQGWSLPALLPGVAIGFPAGWIFAFFQTASVLGNAHPQTPSLTRSAWEQARRWPAQNHLGLLFISFLATAVWLNLATAFYAVPWLCNHLLGMENAMGLGGWWFLNTTFLASVSALTWLAVDPLIKAFYVLRVFYGRSQATGEDLLVELAAHRPRSLSPGATSVLLSLLLFSVSSFSLRAAEPNRPSAIAPQELNRAIDTVLTRRDFRWQLRPQAQPVAAQPESAVKRFFRQGVEMVRETLRSIANATQRFVRWLRELFGRDHELEDSSAASSSMVTPMLRAFLYLLIGALLILLGAVVWTIWRKSSRAPTVVTAARAVTVAQPDLRDESIDASQLPADGWISLAREQIAQGEWRLALRALYLGSLADLATGGLLSLAAFKTNLDYERELRRRAPSNGELHQRFSQRRRRFECTWYGKYPALEVEVREWLQEFERKPLP